MHAFVLLHTSTVDPYNAPLHTSLNCIQFINTEGRETALHSIIVYLVLP